MQEKHLFEYAVIRIVPRVEREEFINAGVILYCASQRFLKTMYEVNEQRLNSFSPGIDVQIIEQRLQAFDCVCKGKDKGGPVGQFPIASRFRWLIATRSTIIQTSKVHPGFCMNAEEEMAKLFAALVSLS